MLHNKWHTRISRLSGHADNKVRYAALQLISNYSQSVNGTPFGNTFGEIAVSLTTKGFILPAATTSNLKHEKKPIDSAHYDENFLKGTDFLEFPFPETSSHSNSHHSVEDVCPMDETSQTIQKIELDVAKLSDAITQCHRIAKAFKAGECARKEVLDSLNMAWVVAEKCHVWSENMQVFLTKTLRQEELTTLLKTNDQLNDGLRSWEGLVSMDIVNGGQSDSESGSSGADESQWQRKPRGFVDAAADRHFASETEVEKLRAENEGLRLAISEMEATHKTAVLKTEAEHVCALKNVKSRAASRIKDLLNQISEHELREKRHEREAEDAQFKLQSANQALLVKDQEAQRLEEEVADIRANLETRIEEARRYQKEIEIQLQQKIEEAAELTVRVANLEGELESERAAARANAAESRAQVEQLSRQVEQANNSATQLRIEEYEAMIANLKLEYRRESILRKKAFNHIRELKGNIRVVARIRPAQPLTPDSDIAIQLHDEYTMDCITKPSGFLNSRRSPNDGAKRYEFDACFGPGASQATVFEETQQLVQSALDGYNVCIFCYGQTGSGKTHTLTGSAQDPGIVPRFMEDLFHSNNTKEHTAVSCYMLELYQDDLLDLLSPASRKSKMQIRTDSDTGLVSVKGATHVDVSDAAEMKATFEAGLKRRKTATTRCNINSSRSHLIFTVLLERVNMITGCQTRSKITFVDLAGSERVVKSGAVNDKERLNEAKAINKSLSALGDVVSALTSRESFVPYRNHKLTELMRDSLGGNAKTLMIVNVSPMESDAKETQNSLDYAQRAKQVTNENSRSHETREITKLKATMEKQAREIQQLKTLKVDHSP